MTLVRPGSWDGSYRNVTITHENIRPTLCFGCLKHISSSHLYTQHMSHESDP